MSQPLPSIYLVRHGETAWTLSRQHTGLTDLPLTDIGERNARHLGERLHPLRVANVFTSPLQRARRTCELAGFGDKAQVDPDLVEWDYGDYEGLTSQQVHERSPKWNLFRDGCPGGESPAQIGARADRCCAAAESECRRHRFSSGHIMRARQPLAWPRPSGGRLFAGADTLSIVGYEHDKRPSRLSNWNDARPDVDG